MSGPLRAHEAGSWVQLGVTRHDDGSLTIPVIPGRHAENGDDGVAPTPGLTGMTIRPGEGGYVKALAQWDAQQRPDQDAAASTASGREQAMQVVHAGAVDREHVADPVAALDDTSTRPRPGSTASSPPRRVSTSHC